MSQSGHVVPTVYATQSNVRSWRMLTFHDENLFRLSIYSIIEVDAAVPLLSGHSHVVRSLEPNHTLFVTYRAVNKILAQHNPVWMVQKFYSTQCILKEILNKRNNPAITLYTTGEIIIVSWKIWTCKSTYKRSLISEAVAKWCVAIRQFSQPFFHDGTRKYFFISRRTPTYETFYGSLVQNKAQRQLVAYWD